MKVIIILIVLCFGATIISSALYGTEIAVGKEWWNENFYLKFNSPSGKSFYIDGIDGIIYLEKDPAFTFGLNPPPGPPPQSGVLVTQTEIPLNARKDSPFISFISIDFRIFDIYFDYDGNNNQNPRLENTKFVYEYKYSLIRSRLHSFVGPNKKNYQITYNVGNEIDIAEKSPNVVDHFQIKTFGPYEKWEHTYDFSDNGAVVVDHTISPIPVQPNRSISLAELEPNSFIGENSIRTFVKFNTPSGTEYHITTQLNIVPVSVMVKDTAYITFTMHNGRTYEIHIDEKVGNAYLVAKSFGENYFGRQRLHSFVAPNRILYRIDHKNESDHEVPVLVPDSSDSSDVHITLVEPNRLYNKYVKYIFSDNGKKLFDRVDEIDWTPLNELPAIPVEEVTADYLVANLPFLTLYTPSGNNYHIFAEGTNLSIAVEKVMTHSQSLYISYGWNKTHIHFAPGADPYLEGTQTTGNEDHVSFQFLSFTTIDQKEYSIKSTIDDDDNWKPSIQLPSQVKEPVDQSPVNGLSITIQNENGWQNVYRFTWNGDKLVEVISEPPRHFVDNKVLQSLIG
ncbi:uncharacterized protein LOC119068841 isoform X2 [Bradysia coprophila]|uniref:uncharacterized protein LOC119068841 isoform X2 n=1 Tax=Bradysia coprophila TaxID=38358 RepID=UPI00187D766F|nr:uncharacterized protein LOC119068841 isoform X2 [Bradysia coprophila]